MPSLIRLMALEYRVQGTFVLRFHTVNTSTRSDQFVIANTIRIDESCPGGLSSHISITLAGFPSSESHLIIELPVMILNTSAFNSAHFPKIRDDFPKSHGKEEVRCVLNVD